MSERTQKTISILIFLVVVVALFTMIALVNDVRTTSVTVSDGVFDLHEVDFSTGVFALTGDIPHEGDARNGVYTIDVMMPDGDYTVAIKSIDYAMRVSIDGKVVEEIGQVGSSREDSVPRTAYVYYPLRVTDGGTTIELAHCNYWLPHADTLSPPVLGTLSQMHQRRMRRGAYDALLIGGMAATFLMLLGLAFFHPHLKANLYLALCCLCILIRTGLVGDRLFSGMFAASWHTGFRMVYIDLALLAISLTLFLSTFFPKLFHRRVPYLFHGASFAFLLGALLLDPMIFALALPYYQVLAIASLIYVCIRIFMSLTSYSQAQLISAIALLVLFVCMILNILVYAGVPLVGSGFTRLMPTLLTICALVQLLSMFIMLQHLMLEANMRVAKAEANYTRMLERQQPQTANLMDYKLAPREMQVVLMLIEGKSRHEIGELLNISIGTVNTYCTNIYKKTGTGGLPELLKLFYIADK